MNETGRSSPGSDISVVVCAYADERWEDLVAAVDSVRAQTVPARDVVVVVDGNEHLRARAEARWDDVVVAANRHDRGLSAARNTGVSIARGAVLAFLDDDAVAAPDWLERLAEGYEDPAVLGVGGAVEPVWARARPRWFPPEFDWVVGCSHIGMPAAALPVRNLIGANMSFRRDAFAVGGFRTDLGRVGRYPAGCEETEFCIRIRAHFGRGKILYDPRARVRHRVPLDRATLGYFSRRCYAEGRSKALLARVAGSEHALAAERVYTRRTLPLGLVQALRVVALRRAAAIGVGLAITSAGYVAGRFPAGAHR